MHMPDRGESTATITAARITRDVAIVIVAVARLLRREGGGDPVCVACIIDQQTFASDNVWEKQ